MPSPTRRASTRKSSSKRSRRRWLRPRARSTARTCDVRVAINRKTGDYDTFRRWKVFADDSTELEVPGARTAPRGRARRRHGRRARRLRRSSRWNRWRSAASPRRQPSRSSCRRCARPSARRSSTRTRTASARWSRGIVKRVDRNGIYVDLGGNAEGFVPRDAHDPARAGAHAGPHQGVPARTCAPSRAVRSCSCRARRRNS